MTPIVNNVGTSSSLDIV